MVDKDDCAVSVDSEILIRYSPPPYFPILSVELYAINPAIMYIKDNLTMHSQQHAIFSNLNAVLTSIANYWNNNQCDRDIKLLDPMEPFHRPMLT